MKPLAETLRTTAQRLWPHRAALAEAWGQGLMEAEGAPGSETKSQDECGRTLNIWLGRLAEGRLNELLEEEALAASEAARAGKSVQDSARALRVLSRCCGRVLAAVCPDRESLAESLLALDELGHRRLEILIQAQEGESHRRLAEAQSQAALLQERARDLAGANEDLRRSEARSQHRADQIGLLSSVAHRLAAILEPERLMQEAAEAIQTRMNHAYVAVVVLDDEGVLVGRWAGRPGVGRLSSGRTQGPAGGVIGRALRKRAPQVVPDVSQDADYHADVSGTRSEMVVPLLEGGEAVGAIDFQSERPSAFDLDDVAAGETLAEFLVITLRNARLFGQARQAGART